MADLGRNPGMYLVLTVLAIATMFVGNLLALLQTNVKRLLAYSSIAQMGYLVVPLIAGGPRGPSSIAFYLASYFATTIAAFGVIAAISSSRGMGDVEDLDDYRGLSRRNPLLAMTFTLALLSLTGIPLTSGFFAKFYIFSAAAQSRLWALLIIAVVNSGISAFYYLRVVVTMYTHPDEEMEAFPAPDVTTRIALAVSAAIVVFFGIYPSPLIRLAEAATRVLRF
jgi:NADH-quinone oxidoreductase subunit N